QRRRTTADHVLLGGLHLYELLLLRSYLGAITRVPTFRNVAKALEMLVHVYGPAGFYRMPVHHGHCKPVLGCGRAVCELLSLPLHQLAARAARVGQRLRRYPVPAGTELAYPARGAWPCCSQLAAAGTDPVPYPPL
ncbi:SLC12A5, partial [Symbiodinium pilosum]